MPLLTRFDSTTIPGASFFLKSPGRKLRHRVEIALCEALHEQTMIAQEQYSLIPEDVRQDPKALMTLLEHLTTEDRRRLSLLKIRQDAVWETIRLAYAQEMLDSFLLPGAEYEELSTPDMLLEAGPVEFADEVINQAEKLWRITADETKNSSSPSTSPAPVDGPTNRGDGTAIAAGNEATTSSETAS